MKLHRTAALALFLVLLPFPALADDYENVVEVEGAAYAVVTPDIAHLVLKISGTGATYEAAAAAAQVKIDEMKRIVEEIIGAEPGATILKKETKPKSGFMSEENIMEMQQEYFKTMAQAMKGEEITGPKGEEKKEMLAEIVLYFPLTDFSDETILRIKSRLAEKSIAFDKSTFMDLSWDFDLKKSAVLFGLQDPYSQLNTLAVAAYAHAKKKAEIIARSVGKRLGGVTEISGCGEEMEGSLRSSEANKHIGLNLGPLSADPNRLTIRYEKDYAFELK